MLTYSCTNGVRAHCALNLMAEHAGTHLLRQWHRFSAPHVKLSLPHVELGVAQARKRCLDQNLLIAVPCKRGTKQTTVSTEQSEGRQTPGIMLLCNRTRAQPNCPTAAERNLEAGHSWYRIIVEENLSCETTTNLRASGCRQWMLLHFIGLPVLFISWPVRKKQLSIDLIRRN